MQILYAVIPELPLVAPVAAAEQRLRSLALSVFNTLASSEVHVDTHLRTDKSTP